MSTVFAPGVFSGQAYEILGGLAIRRGGKWLDNWQNRNKLQRWLDEQAEIAEREARRRKKAPGKISEHGELADLLRGAEAETWHFGKERAASLDGPLKYLLEPV